MTANESGWLGFYLSPTSSFFVRLQNVIGFEIVRSCGDKMDHRRTNSVEEC